MRHAMFLATAAVAGFMMVAPLAQAKDVAQEPGPAVELYDDTEAQAVLDARVIALKTVLRLDADQEKLWRPVEDEIRKIAAAAAARGKQREKSEPPGDFLDVLDRIADAEQVRAQEIKSFVSVARPLVRSLSEEQKRRVPSFLGMTDDPDHPQPTGELWIFEDEIR